MHQHEQLDFLHWLARVGLCGSDEAEIVAGSLRRLRAAGVPVDRGFAGVELIHPLVEGEIFVWESDTDTVRRTHLDRFDEDETEWLASPIYRLHVSGEEMLRRRVGDSYEPGEFPLLDTLVAGGTTDYLAFLGRFAGAYAVGERDETFISFATRQPGGFTDAQAALLHRLAPNCLGALRAASGRRMTHAMMETYLGRDAGRRVLRGGIRRGATEAIDAVLWYSDLHGFTRLTDTLPPDDIVPMLNAYADCQASAVTRAGGEVLKFMGDGILAIFPRQDHIDACPAALNAATAAFDAIGAVNAERREQGLPVTSMYLGLHVGTVLYGNIGSAERLDFTVVGPAVNEVNRIAGMCKALEKDILISSAFAEAAPHCRDRIVSLGRYGLRGVRSPQELFTLDAEHVANGAVCRNGVMAMHRA